MPTISPASSRKAFEVSRLRFIIQQGSIKKKLFSINFSKRDASLYVAFPYFNCKAYRCGTLKIPKGETSQKIDISRKSVASQVEVKFSYHESGKVHFKSVGGGRLSYALPEINSTPIGDLRGEHIFTVSIEGLDVFDDYIPVNEGQEKKVGNVVVPYSEEYSNVRIVVCGGNAYDQLLGRNSKKRKPDVVAMLGRTTLSMPFLLGFHCLGQKEPLIQDNSIKSTLIALVGFDRRMATINNELTSLYLSANS